MPSSCGIDLQHRPGGRAGSGGIASTADINRDRRERLRKLALETIDLNKDPYFMKNHLGQYECRLCLTLHTNEGSYLTHTQGKKHTANLAKRAWEQQKNSNAGPAIAPGQITPKIAYRKFVKIGRPGYKVTKQLAKHAIGGHKQQSLLFQVDYPEIAEGITPRHRFMSAYEQRVEPPNKKYQYLLFAAEPYSAFEKTRRRNFCNFLIFMSEIILKISKNDQMQVVRYKFLNALYETVSFKVPSRDIDRSSDERFWTYWNSTTKQFFMQFHYKIDRGGGLAGGKVYDDDDEKLTKSQRAQKEELKRMPEGAPDGPQRE